MSLFIFQNFSVYISLTLQCKFLFVFKIMYSKRLTQHTGFHSLLTTNRYRVKQTDPKLLINHTLKDFIQSVGARTSAPGGGSVAASVGALVSVC